MKQTYKTNVYLQQLAVDLYRFGNENKVALWKRIADDLIVPTRQKRLVNIFKLDLYSKDGETIIVPGKVLGTGDIHHKVHVAAFDFSRSAVDKIKQNTRRFAKRQLTWFRRDENTVWFEPDQMPEIINYLEGRLTPEQQVRQSS